MARVEVPITVLNSSTGLPVNGASVAISQRATGTPATWYPTETGGVGSTASVITDSNGRVSAWVEPGAYSATVSGTGITTYTEAFDAVSAITDPIGVSLLHTDLQTLLGVTGGGVVRRGKSIISAEHTRTNTAYGTMPLEDKVSGLVLPADGLIFIAYQAMYKQSVAQAGRAAIFLGANQLRGAQNSSAAPVTQETGADLVVTNSYRALSTTEIGLGVGLGSAEYSGHSTTGQLIGRNIDPAAGQGIGGPCLVFAAAGTYDVSVQFKASSGSVTVKDRKLWVWTVAF